MPGPTEFPHLQWTYEGPFTATFGPAWKPNPEVEAAKADPKGHTGRLRGDLESMRRLDERQRRERRAEGLPEIHGKGFLLRVPDGVDVDSLAYALGVTFQ